MAQFTEGTVGDSTQVAKWNFTGKTDKSDENVKEIFC